MYLLAFMPVNKNTAWVPGSSTPYHKWKRHFVQVDMAFHKRPLEQEGVVHTFSTFPFTKEVVANLWMLTLQI